MSQQIIHNSYALYGRLNVITDKIIVTLHIFPFCNYYNFISCAKIDSYSQQTNKSRTFFYLALRNKWTPLQIVITNGYICSLIYYLLLVTTTMFIFLSTSTWAWIISSGYLIFYNVYSLFHTSYKINCLNRWGTE